MSDNVISSDVVIVNVKAPLKICSETLSLLNEQISDNFSFQSFEPSQIFKEKVRYSGAPGYMFTYVIRSLNFEFNYKGHCGNLIERLKQHNSGMTQSIRKFTPFELVYSEEFKSRDEAIRREKYFKSAAGRRFLKTKLPLVQRPPG